MASSEVLTKYVQTLIDALVAQEITQMVISPGSRSTPVVLLLARNAERYGLRLFVDVDERSAGFFALGLTKATQRPTLLVCTSGTAAANYYPAIIEAKQAQQPLLVLTTDRPPELTDIGAPQAIDQVQLYGSHVKSFTQLPLPTACDDELNYLAFNVQRQVQLSQDQPMGPVHFNLPLRKPLMPQLSPAEGQSVVRQLTSQTGTTTLDTQQLSVLAQQLTGKKVLVITGQNSLDLNSAAVLATTTKYGWPIWADVLSQMRDADSDLLFTGFDALLSAKKTLGVAHPDVVIQIGRTPVSAAVSAWLTQFDGPVVTVDLADQLNDVTKATTTHVKMNSANLFEQLATSSIQPAPSEYTRTWVTLTQVFNKVVTRELAAEVLREEQVPYLMSDSLAKANIFISNSMPIRDFNQFYLARENGNRLFCNRGANGIDGVVSTGLGMAAAGFGNNYLVIGDLAFFHDMGGLMMAKRYHLDLTIVLLNNNGGGIFSFLPQAKAQQYFETLFGTPQDLDVSGIAKLYGASYAHAQTVADFRRMLTLESTGLRIIEIQTTREDNVLTHQAFTTQAYQEMREFLDHSS